MEESSNIRDYGVKVIGQSGPMDTQGSPPNSMHSSFVSHPEKDHKLQDPKYTSTRSASPSSRSSSSFSNSISPSPDRKRRDTTVRMSPLPEQNKTNKIPSTKPLPKLRGNPEPVTPDSSEANEELEGNRGRSRIKNRILTNDIPGNPNMISLMGFETAKQKESRPLHSSKSKKESPKTPRVQEFKEP